MTVREALLREIDRAPDEILIILLSILQVTNRGGDAVPIASMPMTQGYYPLRGLPLTMAQDFDEPMTDLWDALGA
jgi:hypothetical protein